VKLLRLLRACELVFLPPIPCWRADHGFAEFENDVLENDTGEPLYSRLTVATAMSLFGVGWCEGKRDGYTQTGFRNHKPARIR
jgi:hypothetical protein